MLRRISLLFAGLFLVASQSAHAVELTWSDGTGRIRASIEARDYQSARDVWVVLARDYPNYDLLFELDMRFAVGEVRDAASILQSIAARQPALLCVQGANRATSWSIFSLQLEALEYHVASHPADDASRLVLGYYLQLSGMPMRAERILSKIAPNAREWRAAQAILDGAQGRCPSNPTAGVTVIATPPNPPDCVYPLGRTPRTSKRPHLSARVGAGALLVAGDDARSPLASVAVGFLNARGYSYELQVSQASLVGVVAEGTRKEVSFASAGLGVSYVGDIPHRTKLRPVVGLGVEALTASPIAAETALALGISGRLGLNLTVPVGRGALQLGVEGLAKKAVSGDSTFPSDTFVSSGLNLGVIF